MAERMCLFFRSKSAFKDFLILFLFYNNFFMIFNCFNMLILKQKQLNSTMLVCPFQSHLAFSTTDETISKKKKKKKRKGKNISPKISPPKNKNKLTPNSSLLSNFEILSLLFFLPFYQSTDNVTPNWLILKEIGRCWRIKLRLCYRGY